MSGVWLTFGFIPANLLKAVWSITPPKIAKNELVGLLRMYADRREDINEVLAGDIGAVLGMKDTFTGDTLCDTATPILLENITFPEPVISVAIEPKTTADQDKMGEALRKLSEEDPTFQVRSDEETGQTIIVGMGELHLGSIGRPHAARIPSSGTSWATTGGLSRIDHQIGSKS